MSVILTQPEPESVSNLSESVRVDQEEENQAQIEIIKTVSFLPGNFGSEKCASLALLWVEEDAPKMWREIGDREAGELRPNSFSNRIKSNRIQTLQLSNHKDIVAPHRGSVNSLQVPKHSIFSTIALILLA